MGAGQVALQIILDFEHARADRLRDRFEDLVVKREFGRALVLLDRLSFLLVFGVGGVCIS